MTPGFQSSRGSVLAPQSLSSPGSVYTPTAPLQVRQSAIKIPPESQGSRDVHVLLDEPSESPLHHAAQHGTHEKVQHLLQGNKRLARRNTRSRNAPSGRDSVDICFLDSHGFTALHYAVRRGGSSEVIVKSLLDLPGGRLNEVRDNLGKSAMHWAAQLGLLGVLELLCNAQASVIAEDCFGWTPLHYLCASAAARDRQRESEVVAMIKLMTAQKSPRGGIMRIWLLRDKVGRTAVHLAARNGATELVLRTLLALEPDNYLAKMKDADGWTPLHCAVFGGHIETVRTLIRAAGVAGSSVEETVDQQTAEGWTALHLTAMALRSEWACEMTEMLVKECGANCFLEDRYGRIPLYYAHLQTFKFSKIESLRLIIPLLGRGGATEAYRQVFSPEKTAFPELDNRLAAFTMRLRPVSFPRDPVPGSGTGPFAKASCLERLENVIHQKQLGPIFSPPNSTPNDLSILLSPYVHSFSTMPLAARVLCRPLSSESESESQKTSTPAMSIPKELLMDLGSLLLFDHAVVIDDSASMGFSLGGSRREFILSVLHNIRVMNQFLNGDTGRELKTLCFSSSPSMRLSAPLVFDESVYGHTFGGTSRVGTGVWEAIVKPFLQNLKLERPMVVMILTDGLIDPEEADILERAILRAKRKLQSIGTSGGMLFQFVNLGYPVATGDTRGSQVLRRLMTHPHLGSLVDVLDWQTDAWDIGETPLMKDPEANNRSNSEQKIMVQRMGRMLLGPIIASYRQLSHMDVDSDRTDSDWDDDSEE